MTSNCKITTTTITTNENDYISAPMTHSLDDSYVVYTNIILDPKFTIQKEPNGYILKINQIDVYLKEEELIDLILELEMALKWIELGL